MFIIHTCDAFNKSKGKRKSARRKVELKSVRRSCRFGIRRQKKFDPFVGDLQSPAVGFPNLTFYSNFRLYAPYNSPHACRGKSFVWCKREVRLRLALSPVFCIFIAGFRSYRRFSVSLSPFFGVIAGKSL